MNPKPMIARNLSSFEGANARGFLTLQSKRLRTQSHSVGLPGSATVFAAFCALAKGPLASTVWRLIYVPHHHFVHSLYYRSC